MNGQFMKPISKYDIESFLFQQRIDYKLRKDEALFECPRCKDKNSFSLNLTTGLYNCKRLNNCGIKGNFYQFKELYGMNLFTETVKNHEKQVSKSTEIKLEKLVFDYQDKDLIKFLKLRGISVESAKHFNIGIHTNPQNQTKWIQFPYFLNAKLVNIKYRQLSEKRFFGESNGTQSLWNLDNCGTDSLIIVEGELDAMSYFELTGKDCVSVPNGASGLKFLETNYHRLQKIREFVLLFDSDEAGQNGALKLAEKLGKSKCKNVILPNVKDLNEFLLSGRKAEELEKLIENAEYFETPVKDFNSQIASIIKRLKNEKTEGNELIKSKTFNSLNLFSSFQKGNLVMVCGSFKSGKTSFSLNLIQDFLKQGYESIIFSLEMAESEIQDKILASESGIRYSTIREKNIEEEHFEILSKVKLNAKLTIFDNIFTLSEIESKIQYLKMVSNPKIVMIDYVGLIQDKNTDNREQAISKATREFKRIAKQYGLLIILLSQMNRDGIENPQIKNIAESLGGARDSDFCYIISKGSKDNDLFFKVHNALSRHSQSGNVFYCGMSESSKMYEVIKKSISQT